MRQASRLCQLSFAFLTLVLATLAGCGGDSFQSATGDVDAGYDGATDSATPDGAGGTDTGAETGTAVLVFEPEEQAFDQTVVGDESEAQALTLRNVGGQTTSALTLSLTGTDAAHYRITQDECSGKTLAPSTTCAVSVVFAPTSAGSFEATLDASAGTIGASATLQGYAAAAPELVISPKQADFGDVQENTASVPHAFEVENVGGLQTEGLTVAFDPPTTGGFELASDHCSDTQLGPTDTCTFEVVFKPQSPIEYTARVVVGSASTQDVSADLIGMGVTAGELGISPTPATLASAVENSVGDCHGLHSDEPWWCAARPYHHVVEGHRCVRVCLEPCRL